MVQVSWGMVTINRKNSNTFPSTFSYSISQPKKIDSLRNVRISQISSANGCENLALISSDGKLYTCGYNNYG
jgi:alpha-tubulin suppressor-like RCC1 family protein